MSPRDHSLSSSADAFDEPSTKSARAFLEGSGLQSPVVIVATEEETSFVKSFRNLQKVAVIAPGELDVSACRLGAVAAPDRDRTRGSHGEGVVMHASQVILTPIVSEKSYEATTRGSYTFKVHPNAHKTQIRQAVEELFDVKVERVNVIKVQAKPKRRGLFKGTRPGWKKAIVQLRAGDTIEIFEGAQI